VQRYWNQWNLNRRLFALGWVAATLLTMILATVGGVINADRLGLVPMCPVGGYLGYRLTRSRWPGLFDAYVSAREKARADHPTS
jgi:fructose-specific phosphotransferase system IIC component